MDELVLVIGLDDGSALRATVDPVTGSISTSHTKRFLGARPVAVSRINLESRPSSLLLSSRPWISRLDPTSGKHIMAPLSYTPLDHGCSFRSEAVREGVVATAGKTLRILSVDTVQEEDSFNTEKIPLRYTPRQMTLLSAGMGNSVGVTETRKIILAVVESDYNEYGQEAKIAMGFDGSGAPGASANAVGKANDESMDMDEGSDDEDAAKKKEGDDGPDVGMDPEEKEARATPIRGPFPPGPGHWGSCVRLLDPSDSCRTLDCVEMNRNEAALCCAAVRFHSKGGEPLLAVGTVANMTLQPLRQSASYIILYRVINGERLQLLHRTAVDDGPVLSLAHFQGRLLVGIGKSLKLYEMGKRQLLRKCELRGLPTYVKTLQTAGDR
jgi:splicing factor 3B subunit 3